MFLLIGCRFLEVKVIFFNVDYMLFKVYSNIKQRKVKIIKLLYLVKRNIGFEILLSILGMKYFFFQVQIFKGIKFSLSLDDIGCFEKCYNFC